MLLCVTFKLQVARLFFCTYSKNIGSACGLHAPPDHRMGWQRAELRRGGRDAEPRCAPHAVVGERGSHVTLRPAAGGSAHVRRRARRGGEAEV